MTDVHSVPEAHVKLVSEVCIWPGAWIDGCSVEICKPEGCIQRGFSFSALPKGLLALVECFVAREWT